MTWKTLPEIFGDEEWDRISSLLEANGYAVGRRDRRKDHAFVSVDPAMMSGDPCIAHRRIPVETIAGFIWAGDSSAIVEYGYDLRRCDVLVACWYVGWYGTRTWRKRWKAWADEVHPALWAASKVDYDAIPMPPSRQDGAHAEP